MTSVLGNSILFTVLLSLCGTIAGAVNFCSWYKNVLECQKDEFRCLNGEHCIDRMLYCNGEDDCGDNSDEEYCSVYSCPKNFMRCYIYNNHVTKCIPNEWICNNYQDCDSGFDENNCRHTTVRSETRFATKKNRTVVNNVHRWITFQQKVDSTEKWGYEVDRFAMLLYLAYDDPHTFHSTSYKEEMAYEISIQLLSQLSRMKLEDIPSTELASYINAFLVTCINPRKFHGYDIIKELRNRAGQENYTNPYVFLALCNAGETITESDKNKLIETFENKHRTFWTDTQAVVVMALACASKQPNNEVDPDTLRDMAMELKQQQFRNGTVINLPTTALVMQALISINSESDPDNFDEVKAFQELVRNQKSDGSFGDLMNTFLVTPVLTCKSLVDVNSTYCHYGSIDGPADILPKDNDHYVMWYRRGTWVD